MTFDDWDIWKVLKEQAEQHNGRTIITSMLGNVHALKIYGGELTGWIPPALQARAKEHGLVIEAALWKEGHYVLRALTHNV